MSNIQCRVMKNYNQQDNTTLDVDSWTLQQCEQYLLRYPNGLKSERVRARKQALSPKKKTVTSSPPSPPKTSHTNGGDTSGKVLLTILVIGIAVGLFIMFASFFQKYHSIFVASIMVGLVPLLKHIWR